MTQETDFCSERTGPTLRQPLLATWSMSHRPHSCVVDVASTTFRAGDTLAGMRSARAPWVALVLDVCCVLVFVIIGRASHTKGEAVGGIASTAWPFLAGLAAGWLAARAWRSKDCSAVAFWLAAAISGYWSFALGLFVLQVALTI